MHRKTMIVSLIVTLLATLLVSLIVAIKVERKIGLYSWWILALLEKECVQTLPPMMLPA